MSSKQGQQYRHLPAFILLILAEGETHGGSILTNLNEKLPNFNCDSAGVYRTLNQLESEGCVIYNWDTSKPGPAKKIYQITEVGFKKLALFKNDIEKRLANFKYFLDEYSKLKK
jgi:DNA-binding PadR family transcriptional regulator